MRTHGLSRLLLLCLSASLLPGCLRGTHYPGSAGQPSPQPGAQVLAAPPRESPTTVIVVPTGSHGPMVTAADPPPVKYESIHSALADRTPKPELEQMSSDKPDLPKPAVEPRVEELSRLLAVLKAMLDDRPADALELLKAYPATDQDLLLALLPIVAQVEQKRTPWHERLDDAQKLAVIQTLRSLLAGLELSAPLVITKLDFAQDVKSFGRYEPLANATFKPMDLVTLYMEVENVRDRRVKEGDRYVARLSSALLVRGEHSNKGWTQTVKSTPDWSRSERDDHFAVIRFSMPKDAKPGLYVMIVTVVDQETQRQTERGLTFRIVSPAVAERVKKLASVEG